jgi:hypothetical protein
LLMRDPSPVAKTAVISVRRIPVRANIFSLDHVYGIGQK